MENKINGAVLKLELCTGWGDIPQIHFVPLETVTDENGKADYHLLLAVAMSHAYPNETNTSTNDEIQDFEVTVTYIDIDNECVTLSTTEELEDAIEQQSNATFAFKIMLRRMRSALRRNQRQAKMTPATLVCISSATKDPDAYLHDLYLETDEFKVRNDSVGLETTNCLHFENLQSAAQLVRQHLQLMEHASCCLLTPTCPVKECGKMKICLQHASACQIKVCGGCEKCKQILLELHAKMCQVTVCPIPQCLEIRERQRPEPPLQAAVEPPSIFRTSHAISPDMCSASHSQVLPAESPTQRFAPSLVASTARPSLPMKHQQDPVLQNVSGAPSLGQSRAASPETTTSLDSWPEIKGIFADCDEERPLDNLPDDTWHEDESIAETAIFTSNQIDEVVKFAWGLQQISVSATAVCPLLRFSLEVCRHDRRKLMGALINSGHLEHMVGRERLAGAYGIISDAIAMAESVVTQHASDIDTGCGGFNESATDSDSHGADIPSSPSVSPGGGAAMESNVLTVFFSSPLQCCDRVWEMPDFNPERTAIWQAVKSAARDIEVVFDTASSNRLTAALTNKCTCFHFSGHGNDDSLHFEDCDFFVVGIESLVEISGGSPIKFVFVSSSNAFEAGERFVQAGVPHVVCCKNDEEAGESALEFTRAFYLALASGRTVKDAFDKGCNERCKPFKKMSDVALLPNGCNHNIAIFNAKPVLDWPVGTVKGRVGHTEPDLQALNMIQECPSLMPPPFFLGRDSDMLRVLSALAESRLVNVVGEPGIGRSSLVCALCHYINERKSTMTSIEEIYYVWPSRSATCRNVILQTLNMLPEAGKRNIQGTDLYTDAIIEVICRFLKTKKALIVIDQTRWQYERETAEEFTTFVTMLLQDTQNVKVMLAGATRIFPFGDQIEKSIELGPLDLLNSVRLFSKICPDLCGCKERRAFCNRIVDNLEQAHLRPNDPGLNIRSRHIFQLLGNGVPAAIVETAKNLRAIELLRCMEWLA